MSKDKPKLNKEYLSALGGGDKKKSPKSVRSDQEDEEDLEDFDDGAISVSSGDEDEEVEEEVEEIASGDDKKKGSSSRRTSVSSLGSDLDLGDESDDDRNPSLQFSYSEIKIKKDADAQEIPISITPQIGVSYDYDAQILAFSLSALEIEAEDDEKGEKIAQAVENISSLQQTGKFVVVIIDSEGEENPEKYKRLGELGLKPDLVVRSLNFERAKDVFDKPRDLEKLQCRYELDGTQIKIPTAFVNATSQNFQEDVVVSDETKAAASSSFGRNEDNPELRGVNPLLYTAGKFVECEGPYNEYYYSVNSRYSAFYCNQIDNIRFVGSKNIPVCKIGEQTTYEMLQDVSGKKITHANSIYEAFADEGKEFVKAKAKLLLGKLNNLISKINDPAHIFDEKGVVDEIDKIFGKVLEYGVEKLFIGGAEDPRESPVLKVFQQYGFGSEEKKFLPQVFRDKILEKAREFDKGFSLSDFFTSVGEDGSSHLAEMIFATKFLYVKAVVEEIKKEKSDLTHFFEQKNYRGKTVIEYAEYRHPDRKEDQEELEKIINYLKQEKEKLDKKKPQEEIAEDLPLPETVDNEDALSVASESPEEREDEVEDEVDGDDTRSNVSREDDWLNEDKDSHLRDTELPSPANPPETPLSGVVGSSATNPPPGTRTGESSPSLRATDLPSVNPLQTQFSPPRPGWLSSGVGSLPSELGASSSPFASLDTAFLPLSWPPFEAAATPRSGAEEERLAATATPPLIATNPPSGPVVSSSSSSSASSALGTETGNPPLGTGGSLPGTGAGGSLPGTGAGGSLPGTGGSSATSPLSTKISFSIKKLREDTYEENEVFENEDPSKSFSFFRPTVLLETFEQGTDKKNGELNLTKDSGDKFDFSTTKTISPNYEEYINAVMGALNQTRDQMNAVFKSKGKAEITDETIAKLILLASKNEGIGHPKNQVLFNKDFENLFPKKDFSKKDAEEFSKIFQKKCEDSAFYTGNQKASELVGLRLKRLEPSWAAYRFGGIIGENDFLEKSAKTDEFLKICSDLSGEEVKDFSQIKSLFNKTPSSTLKRTVAAPMVGSKFHSKL